MRGTDLTTKVDSIIQLCSQTAWQNPIKAEQYAASALQLSRKINYNKGIAYSNYYLAMLLSDNEFDLAEPFLISANEYAEQQYDSVLLAKTYNLIGKIKDKLGQNKEAEDYYLKALKIIKAYGNDSTAASIYNNLAIINNTKGDNLKAIQQYQKAISLNLKHNNQQWLSINYMNLSNIFLDQLEYDSTRRYLNKSLSIAEKHNFQRFLSVVHNMFCCYYDRQKEYDSALIFAKKALFFAQNTNNLRQERTALINIGKLYNNLNQPDSAYYYSEKQRQVGDSIQKHDRIVALDQMELKIKYEGLLAINELRHQNDLIKYLLVIASLMIIVLSVVVIVISQRQRLRQNRMDNERLIHNIQLKARETATKALFLGNKNKLINDVIEALNKPEQSYKKANQKHINNIISGLKLNQNTNIWEAFEKEFTEVHPSFYKNLQQQYPTLTRNEKRLCAFLKMNMSSKEIASILHLSSDSVNKARTRLRKKINLTGREENLQEVIAEISSEETQTLSSTISRQ